MPQRRRIGAYLERYKGLKARYEATTQQLKQIEDQRAEHKQRRQKMLEFIRMLEGTKRMDC